MRRLMVLAAAGLAGCGAQPEPEPAGAYSPDGRRFATLGARGEIKVIDVARRRTRTIAHPPKRAYRLLAWASSGWLFYNAGHGRIGAWRPGEPGRLLSVTVRQYVDMAAD